MVSKYERIRCPKCPEADLHTFGQEVRFLDHLADVHGVKDPFALYLELHHSNVQPTCECKDDCTAKLPWAGWKKGFTSRYARGHNARVFTSFSDPEATKKAVATRKEGYATGRLKVWNEGLTKETSGIVARSSEKISSTLNERYESGRLVDWHISDPKKAKIAAARSSQTKQAQFATGELVTWNKGFTKDTHASVLKASASSVKNYLENPDASAKRSTPEQLVEQTSKGQLEVLEFVRSLGVEAVSNDRDQIAPKELDIYVPSHRVAIECNSLYFHSTEFIKSATHHQDKLEACNAAGIKLLSFYEDEWRDKRHLIEGMIRHRLGAGAKALDARKLVLRQLSVDEARSFFSECHLEGFARSAIAFGLLNGTEVVAAMALRRPFHSTHAAHMEVSRSVVKVGYNVRGWLGRLTSACGKWAKAKGKQGLMTYVDARVGKGDGYKAAGWKLAKASTGPRLHWTDFSNRFNRFKYKADKSRNMTQKDICEEAGVVALWGCSNSSWVFHC